MRAPLTKSFDDAVASGTACTSLPGSAAFITSTGALSWTPDWTAWGPFELKVTGTNANGTASVYEVVDIQPYYFQPAALVGRWEAYRSIPC